MKLYQEAREFRKRISVFCKTLPKNEQYRLVDQLIRFSRSVTAQIAEGFWSFPSPGKHSVLPGSERVIYQVHEHLNVAFDEEYIDSAYLQELFEEKRQYHASSEWVYNYLRQAKKDHIGKPTDSE